MAKTARKFTKESLRQILIKAPDMLSVIDLADLYSVPPKMIMEMLEELKEDKYRVKVRIPGSNEVSTFGIDNIPMPGGKHPFDVNMWKAGKFKFGITTDNHLCNHNSREDVLNLLYDIFQDEGITTVYNAGNWVDGEFRFNKNEIFIHGFSKQIEYVAKHWPYREGMKTRFIVGDDHEGWWVQREGIDVGPILERERFAQTGYNDMEYLGYAEADIMLSPPDSKHKTFMRVVHPGGGSAYALSYAMQKLAESYQGGEKPAVVVAGHYHKFDFTYPREIYTIQGGTTCDQTLFMRKHKIQAMVGGCVVEGHMNADGIITRLKVEWIPFYDKKFYIGQKKYFR